MSSSLENNIYLDQVKTNLHIARAFQYYDGVHRKPLTPRMGEPDDSVTINLARTIVDVGVAQLFGQDIEIQVEDGHQAKQDFLDLFWKQNQKIGLLQKAAVNGGIAGHCFIRILPGQPCPRLVVLDPAGVTVQTDPDDCSEVWSYTITPQGDQDGDEPACRTLIQSPSGQAGYETGLPNDQWFITDQEWQSGQWVSVRSQAWAWSFPPIADAQNAGRPNDFWGTSDLTPDVLHLIDVINRVASHLNKTLRYFAHPTVYSKGMGSRQIDRSIDAIIHLPSTEASLEVLEMQSDLGSSLNYLDRLIQYLSMITRIPTTAMGIPDQQGAISGVALKIRYAPLVQKTEAKRLTYGRMIECISSWVLEMAGLGSGTEINLAWFNLVPSDDLQEAQMAQAIEALGIISKHTLASRFDLDYDSELKQLALEKQDKTQLGLGTPAQLTQNTDVGNSNDSGTCPCCDLNAQACTCESNCAMCDCSGKGKNMTEESTSSDVSN